MIGGWCMEDSQIWNSVEQYDPEEDCWVQLPPLLFERQGMRVGHLTLCDWRLLLSPWMTVPGRGKVNVEVSEAISVQSAQEHFVGARVLVKNTGRT